MFLWLRDSILPWAMYAASLFNLLLLIWLGLTVWWSAQNRTLGSVLSSAGFLVGALFFALHTVALDYSLDTLLETSPLWWLLLAAPVVALPFGWMILMLWYCGFWEESGDKLRTRVNGPFLVAVALLFVISAISVAALPKISASPFTFLDDKNFSQFYSFRGALILYPAFLVICTATALVALSRPAPSGHWSREVSRRRAHPYLFASSLVQFLVSCAVAIALLYLGILGDEYAIYNTASALAEWLDLTDFFLCLAISLAVMLLGKAVVSFEIFTGRVLPRRGFWRQWRAVVLVAAIYSTTIAAALGPDWRPIYSILLSAISLGVALAIFSNRAYSDHSRGVKRLAPFVASGHLLDGLLNDNADLERAIQTPFQALCEEVLMAGRAALVPSPQIAPLFGAPRVYPPQLPIQNEWSNLAQNVPRDVTSLPKNSGMDYLVPLEKGVLLLGPRRDGGLYTLEEIEVARAAGEHLLDSGAGATLAARLTRLQRQKVAEVATLDRHARRTLHDDILPLLHSALLFPDESGEKIMAAHRAISRLLREAPTDSPLTRQKFSEALQNELEVELAGAFDETRLEISPEAEQHLENLPPVLATTLFFSAREAIRNSAKHGRGKNPGHNLKIQVRAFCEGDLRLQIHDNGTQNDAPPEKSGGSGGGLGLHAAMLAVAGGSLVKHQDESGTRVELRLPIENCASF